MKKLTLPGSKSITNRDLVLAALHSGKTILRGALLSDDTKHMMNALGELGINITESGEEIEVMGGKEHIASDGAEIFLGQSGTSIRFLVGLAVVLEVGSVTFYGDERLNERPLNALIEGVRQLGLKVECREGGLPPVTIFGGKLVNNKLKMDGTVSSQFFTAMMNVGGFIEGGLEIEVEGDLVSKPYIDMTILELSKFGIDVENEDYKNFIISPLLTSPQGRGIAQKDSFSLGGKDAGKADRGITIEGDASALSYIANYITLNGGEIKITNLGDVTKQGDYQYLEVLKKCFGLEYSSDGETTVLKSAGLKNIASLGLKGSCLKGGGDNKKIDFENMPDISMSFMSLAIFLPGKTHITGLKTLNLKECLRIDAMRDELIKLGVEVTSTQDSISIGEYNEELYFGENIKIETYHDHRIAMTFAVLGLYLGKNFGQNLEILNPHCVNKTYPKFWEDLRFLEE